MQEVNGYNHEDIEWLQYIAERPGGEAYGYSMTRQERKDTIEDNFKKGQGFHITNVVKPGQADTPPVFQNAGYTAALLVRTSDSEQAAVRRPPFLLARTLFSPS